MAQWRRQIAVPLVALVAISRGAGASTQSSLTRVQDTLRSLLKSVQDSGRSADQLFDVRRQWCDSTGKSFSAWSDSSHSSADHLRSDLEEQEASAEETQGTLGQLRSQIALVQHTMAVTEEQLQANKSSSDKRHALSDLFASRQTTLMTLEAELDSLLPALSQVQAEAAETKRQIEDQTSSADSTTALVQAVQESCSQSLDREKNSARARVHEASAISKAMKALEKVEATAKEEPAESSDESDESSTEDDEATDAVSFLQTNSAEVAEDELISLFGGVRQQPEAEQTAEEKAKPHKSKKTAPQPAALLAKIKRVDHGADQQQWCDNEHARNQQILDTATLSAERADAETRSHSEMEQELSARLTSLESAAQNLNSAAKEAANQTAQELALLQAGGRDQSLATKIIQQASTILANSEMATQSEAGAAIKDAVKALATAQKVFQAQADSLDSSNKAVQNQDEALSSNARELARALGRQRQTLQLARDNHASQRLRSEEAQKAHEAEEQEATAFLQKLDAGCSKAAVAHQKQRRSAEVRALEDAGKVMKGKRVGHGTKGNSLRGKKKVDMSKLSPIERAALEMGVSDDDN